MPPPKLNPAKRWSLEHRLKVWLSNDLSTPSGRRRAWLATHLVDHAFLRKLWHNFEMVSDGVYRANQPDPKRLAYYHGLGIREIVSLRGHNTTAVHAFETEACAALGLRLSAVNLSARKLRPGQDYIAVLDLIAGAKGPVLFHCKSGADRTGIIAAMHLIAHCGKTVAEVRRQLSWAYIHSSKTDTGVLDHMLECYARDGETAGIPLRNWLTEVYDPEAITAEFNATPRADRPMRFDSSS